MTAPSSRGRMRVVAIAITITAAAASSNTRAQAGPADEGKASFEPCSACHTIDGSDGAGPTLQGIAGRKAASVAGFRYSRALRNSNITWNAASLDAFLADPQKAVPGTVMPYSGLADVRRRTALVAYLLTLPPIARP